MNDKTKKVAAILIGALACGGVGASIHSLATQPKIITEQVVEVVEVPVEVVKEVNVTTEKIVEVDNGDLALVCQRMEDKGILSDVADCVKEIKAEDEALALAVAEIRAELADSLEDEDLVRDEDDVRLIEIKSDYEDVEVVKADFDDEQYKFKIDVRFEDERKDKKQTVTYTVEVESGEAEIKNIE